MSTLTPVDPPVRLPFFVECDCDCHTDEAILHFAPCCDGPCPGCRRNFIGLAAHHEAEHGAPLDRSTPACARPATVGVSRRRRKRSKGVGHG